MFSSFGLMIGSHEPENVLVMSPSPKRNLKSRVYNVAGFSISAKQIADEVKKFFPKFNITYKVNPERQRIVDSWPIDVDDLNAQKDWGWKKKYDFQKTFADYLIPKVKKRYLP